MSSQKSFQQLTMEKEQALADLNSVERSLSDLFRRYENLKGVLEGFKKVPVLCLLSPRWRVFLEMGRQTHVPKVGWPGSRESGTLGGMSESFLSSVRATSPGHDQSVAEHVRSWGPQTLEEFYKCSWSFTNFSKVKGSQAIAQKNSD